MAYIIHMDLHLTYSGVAPIPTPYTYHSSWNTRHMVEVLSSSTLS